MGSLNELKVELDEPSTPSFGASLASKPSSYLATPATPTPANLMYEHRIRSLVHHQGDVDDSPLLAGRPPAGDRWGSMAREASTTPEGPPPWVTMRDVFAQRKPPTLEQNQPRPQQEAEELEKLEALQIVISPTSSVDGAQSHDDNDAAYDDNQDDEVDNFRPQHGRSSTVSSTLTESDLYSLVRSSTSSGGGVPSSLGRSTGSTQFKARPAPPTTYAPEHRVRQSRASLLRAGLDPDAQTLGEATVDHVPTDFTAVPGHKRSRSNLKLDVASIRKPTISPRENRASLIRQGKLPPPSALRRAPSDVADAHAALFAHTPGHRRSTTISVASTLPPSIAPRQTRASSLRAKDDEAYRSHAALERERAIERAERVKAEEEKKKERRRSTMVLPASLREPVVVPRQTEASLLRTSSDGPGQRTAKFGLSVNHSRSSSTASVAIATHALDDTFVSSDPTISSVPDSREKPTSSVPLAPAVPDLASLSAPTYPVRQTRSALLRSGAPELPPTTAQRLTKKTKEEIFAGVPGHKRRQSIQVLSTISAPGIAPRQNRAALLRSSMMVLKPSGFTAGAAVEAGAAASSTAPTTNNVIRPASAAAGSISRASAPRLPTLGPLRSSDAQRAPSASAAGPRPPPSSFRSSFGPARPGSATPSDSRPASRATDGGPQPTSRPPSAARKGAPSPAPSIVPRENGAAKLRRLKRASVSF